MRDDPSLELLESAGALDTLDRGDLASDLMLSEEGGVRLSLLWPLLPAPVFFLGGVLLSESELVTIGLP